MVENTGTWEEVELLKLVVADLGCYPLFLRSWAWFNWKAFLNCYDQINIGLWNYPEEHYCWDNEHTVMSEYGSESIILLGELSYNIDIVNVIFIVTSNSMNLLKKLSLYHKNTRQLFSLLGEKDEFVLAQMKALGAFYSRDSCRGTKLFRIRAEQQGEMGNVLLNR